MDPNPLLWCELECLNYFPLLYRYKIRSTHRKKLVLKTLVILFPTSELQSIIYSMKVEITYEIHKCLYLNNHYTGVESFFNIKISLAMPWGLFVVGPNKTDDRQSLTALSLYSKAFELSAHCKKQINDNSYQVLFST